MCLRKIMLLARFTSRSSLSLVMVPSSAFLGGPRAVAIGGHVSGGASPLGTRKHKSGKQH